MLIRPTDLSSHYFEGMTNHFRFKDDHYCTLYKLILHKGRMKPSNTQWSKWCTTVLSLCGCALHPTPHAANPSSLPVTISASRPFSLLHSTSPESRRIWAWKTNTCLLCIVKIKVPRRQLRDNQWNDEWPCLLVKVGRMGYSMNESSARVLPHIRRCETRLTGLIMEAVKVIDLGRQRKLTHAWANMHIQILWSH